MVFFLCVLTNVASPLAQSCSARSNYPFIVWSGFAKFLFDLAIRLIKIIPVLHTLQ